MASRPPRTSTRAHAPPPEARVPRPPSVNPPRVPSNSSRAPSPRRMAAPGASSQSPRADRPRAFTAPPSHSLARASSPQPIRSPSSPTTTTARSPRNSSSLPTASFRQVLLQAFHSRELPIFGCSTHHSSSRSKARSVPARLSRHPRPRASTPSPQSNSHFSPTAESRPPPPTAPSTFSTASPGHSHAMPPVFSASCAWTSSPP